MNFSDFIHDLKDRLNAKNIADLYRLLGGEEKVGISLRHFQSVENGSRTPPEALFVNLYKVIRPTDKKAFVISYLTSLLIKEDSEQIISYLEKYLSPEIEKTQKNIWDSRSSVYFTDEQVEFLIDNPDCFKFHKKLLLQEKIPLKLAPIKKSRLEEMKNLDLISINGKYILPFSTLCRLPTRETHGPKSVATASKYILKHLDVFLSREGTERQALGYGFQMVSEANAKRIHEQIISLKKWVQSLASTASDKELTVPLVFVGFSKAIEWKELE